VWSLSSILIIHDTTAINSPTTLAITSDDIYNDSGIIVLGSPFHIGYYQNIVRNQKSEISNESSLGTFTGKGSSTGH